MISPISGLPQALDTSSDSIAVASLPRDMQVAEIAPQTQVLRSRLWDRLKFEVEYGRRRGTTSNSYLIQADYTALIDPPGESFCDLYLSELPKYLDLVQLDYIITSHVNPNRMVTLEELMRLAPKAKLVCSRPAVKVLKATFPHWEERFQTVRSQDTLDLGQGHELQLMTVPTPRWPDGLCTYDFATQVLFSDKLFGTHVCGDAIFDEDWRQLSGDRRFYFDCLHAPQTKQVETALDQFDPLNLKTIAPGHGPLVRFSLSRLYGDYRQWCQQQPRQTLKVVLIYASAYGNTATMAQAIAKGLIKAGVAVETINCEIAETDEIAEAIQACDGFIIGSPTLGSHAPVQIQTALGIVLSSATKTKLAGVFGSYGWSGEAIDLIETKLKDGGYRFGFETIRIQFSPGPDALDNCTTSGANFARQLRTRKRQRVARQATTETQADRTQQAVGRIIGSIGVVTTQSNGRHRGILTSWVSQASFTPAGIMLTIPTQCDAYGLAQQNTAFVLNLLQEGRSVRRHFVPQPLPKDGDDNPFSTVEHYSAQNGCLILAEALAYLECRVQSWSDIGDHVLIYATVQAGQVLQPNGITAMRHRKSGGQY
ncbi:diflavin flavoprotein [Synechocystis sp. LEGE 06083]|uniref:diflavin flavoprotein n=1 Tax=Synechocystis sp. LEGE 06083 TaxID=915336 RepID=UPI00187EF94B|nr:diflavin flavoprotein [Synechocystis sp. LEGE 06083]MBE9194329.1 diflavin flavoprotein [Synechocystis sp. LEGE 06083]